LPGTPQTPHNVNQTFTPINTTHSNKNNFTRVIDTITLPLSKTAGGSLAYPHDSALTTARPAAVIAGRHEIFMIPSSGLHKGRLVFILIQYNFRRL
jgi:hypothetical protein